jgi:hypothetical protein
MLFLMKSKASVAMFKNKLNHVKQKFVNAFKKDKAEEEAVPKIDAIENNKDGTDGKTEATWRSVISRKNRTSIRARRKLETTFSNEDYFDAVSQFSNRSSQIEQKVSDTGTDVKIKETIPGRSRRTEINSKLNTSNMSTLLKVLKSFVGRDLTTIPVPATFFSEPLSFLQRNVEVLEYSYLLDKAATCSDSLEQMAYVTAFSISEYSNFYDRIAKPFNPLLNETFEYDREEDRGWKCFAEQVSHHPPRFAM